MIAYRILVGIDILVLLVAAFFFVWGLTDGSVSSFNIIEWLALMFGIAVLLGGGIALQRQGLLRFANVMLAVLAVPAVGGAVFFLVLLLTVDRWN